ncbi:MAG: 3-isopropylmalate dehydratase large subunit [Methanospirillaceae archaeon]|nr:3-isopropylmalate dehydratase large subunit [Methanospirillaceae archaeon]
MATLSERILNAPAGTCIDAQADRAFCHDGTGVLTKVAWEEMGSPPIKQPFRISIIFDHIAPANTSLTAQLQHELREFARAHTMHFSDIGGGVCHQVMSEGSALPGELIIGADSHSCTLGAFGAFATGVGATEMAAIWATGGTWLMVPETIAITMSGSLPSHVEAKDIALAYCGRLGMDGATYRAIEFIGDAMPKLDMADRLTLCNMAVETGAKTGLCYADEVTGSYLANYGTHIPVQEPEPCTYEKEIHLSLDEMVPLVAVPDRVDTVSPVSEYMGTPIDQVFVGTCTNGRYKDLERFASILSDDMVMVRTIIVPASRAVLSEAVQSGVLQTLIEAGCSIGVPGCGPCLGAHMGVLGPGEIGLSTANRNFKNRMGVDARYFLSSVTTAACSALAGEITDPGEFL